MKKIISYIKEFRGWIILNIIILLSIILAFYIAKNIVPKDNIDINGNNKIHFKNYETNYILKINSNKTQNTYRGTEICKNEIRKNIFKDSLNKTVEIIEKNNEITISAEEQKRIYTLPKENFALSMFSLKDFITKYEEGKQNNNKYIVKEYEENNNFIIEIKYNEDINIKMSKLVINKNTKNPILIANYDKNNNIVSKIDFVDFKAVK